MGKGKPEGLGQRKCRTVIPWSKMSGYERPSKYFLSHQGGISFSQAPTELSPCDHEQAREDKVMTEPCAADLRCTRQTQFFSLLFHNDSDGPDGAPVRLEMQLSIIHPTSGCTQGLSGCHVLLTHHQISSTSCTETTHFPPD